MGMAITAMYAALSLITSKLPYMSDKIPGGQDGRTTGISKGVRAICEYEKDVVIDGKGKRLLA